jgi:plasmid replication initiation protein
MNEIVKKKKVNKDMVSIRKSNDLVEARYRFDIWETRIFTKMLSVIRSDDQDFSEYKIYISELIRDFNLTSDKNAYAMVKQGAEKLMRKIIKVIMKDEGNWVEFQTPIIGSLKSTLDDSDGSYIKIGFHPDMKPYLLELKERYLVYDFKNVSNLRSPYYVRIYELLKQYEKIGWRKFEVQSLKEILGITDEYNLYGHFKAKIIDKAQENLNAFTDISFTYEEIKQGRSVNAIVFTIFSNKPTKKKKSQKEIKPLPSLFDEYELITEQDDSRVEPFEKTISNQFGKVYEQVKIWNISEEVLSLLFETQTEDAILNGLAYTLNAVKTSKVTGNIAGFFIKAVKEKYTDPVFEKQQEKGKREQIRQQKEVFKRKLNEQLLTLRDEFDFRRNVIIRELTAVDETITQQAISALQTELLSYFKLKNLNPADLDVEHYRRDSVLRIFVIEKIQLLYAPAFEEIIPIQKEIKELEVQLKRMN